MSNVKSVPVVPGGGSKSTGWVKPLAEHLDQLEADIAGLEARVTNPVNSGVPTAYQGFRVFEPEADVLMLDTDQSGSSSNPVNYIIHDATLYEIPVRMSGPGVFVAERIDVAIYQRLFRPDFGPQHIYFTPNQFMWTDWTTKFCVYPVQPTTAPGHPLWNATNFFWNMLDGKSGRMLADDLVPSIMLMPRTTRNVPAIGLESHRINDGGSFLLDVPWLFERDGQANFQIRFITPMFQFASSVAGTDPAMGLPYDDRENGVRNEAITVSVEIHGYRYETDQDAMKAGALTRASRE